MTGHGTVVVTVDDVCEGVVDAAMSLPEIVVDALDGDAGGLVLSMSPADGSVADVCAAVRGKARQYRAEGLHVHVSDVRREQVVARYAVAGVLFAEPPREWIA